jgi:hypothetical protein
MALLTYCSNNYGVVSAHSRNFWAKTPFPKMEKFSMINNNYELYVK